MARHRSLNSSLHVDRFPTVSDGPSHIYTLSAALGPGASFSPYGPTALQDQVAHGCGPSPNILAFELNNPDTSFNLGGSFDNDGAVSLSNDGSSPSTSEEHRGRSEIFQVAPLGSPQTVLPWQSQMQIPTVLLESPLGSLSQLYGPDDLDGSASIVSLPNSRLFEPRPLEHVTQTPVALPGGTQLNFPMLEPAVMSSSSTGFSSAVPSLIPQQITPLEESLRSQATPPQDPAPINDLPVTIQRESLPDSFLLARVDAKSEYSFISKTTVTNLGLKVHRAPRTMRPSSTPVESGANPTRYTSFVADIERLGLTNCYFQALILDWDDPFCHIYFGGRDLARRSGPAKLHADVYKSNKPITAGISPPLFYLTPGARLANANIDHLVARIGIDNITQDWRHPIPSPGGSRGSWLMALPGQRRYSWSSNLISPALEPDIFDQFSPAPPPLGPFISVYGEDHGRDGLFPPQAGSRALDFDKWGIPPYDLAGDDYAIQGLGGMKRNADDMA